MYSILIVLSLWGLRPSSSLLPEVDGVDFRGNGIGLGNPIPKYWRARSYTTCNLPIYSVTHSICTPCTFSWGAERTTTGHAMRRRQPKVTKPPNTPRGPTTKSSKPNYHIWHQNKKVGQTVKIFSLISVRIILCPNNNANKF